MLLAHTLVQELKNKGALLATVESCTGGKIASTLVEVPGISAVYWGSWVTYQSSAKASLGVPQSLLETQGAVSVEVALQLAECGLYQMEQSIAVPMTKGAPSSLLICLSVTGVTGPASESGKNVGVAYLGLAMRGRTACVKEVFGGAEKSRIELQSLFTQEALQFLKQNLL